MSEKDLKSSSTSGPKSEAPPIFVTLTPEAPSKEGGAPPKPSKVSAVSRHSKNSVASQKKSVAINPEQSQGKTSGAMKEAETPAAVPVKDEAEQQEICSIQQEEECSPTCHCPKSRWYKLREEEELQKRRRANDEIPRPSIENRNGFYKALEECCYNPRYCPYIIYNRWANERAKYARNQYPLTTTQKSDYRPFKPTDPENDIRIMGLIRGWGLGPDFLHHPHLDSISSPEPEGLYRETYTRYDCCRNGKQSIMPYHDYPYSTGCARNMCNTQYESDYLKIVNPGYRTKFTLLGDNPLPHSYNTRNPTYSHKHDDQINEYYYKPQRFVGRPMYPEPLSHFECFR